MVDSGIPLTKPSPPNGVPILHDYSISKSNYLKSFRYLIAHQNPPQL